MATTQEDSADYFANISAHSKQDHCFEFVKSVINTTLTLNIFPKDLCDSKFCIGNTAGSYVYCKCIHIFTL